MTACSARRVRWPARRAAAAGAASTIAASQRPCPGRLSASGVPIRSKGSTANPVSPVTMPAAVPPPRAVPPTCVASALAARNDVAISVTTSVAMRPPGRSAEGREEGERRDEHPAGGARGAHLPVVSHRAEVTGPARPARRAAAGCPRSAPPARPRHSPPPARRSRARCRPTAGRRSEAARRALHPSANRSRAARPSTAARSACMAQPHSRRVRGRRRTTSARYDSARSRPGSTA